MGAQEEGEGRVNSGEWRAESGERRVESGEWRVERGENKKQELTFCKHLIDKTQTRGV